MLPDPLHPAVVHFPIVLAFLFPISAVVALWAIRKGARYSRAWLVPVAVAGALAASSWLAVETGEQQEERVERVVAEAPLDKHAEAAEGFLAFSAAAFVLTAAGLFGTRAGTALRAVATVGAFALVVAGARVGHSGGQLVYTHGAAAAYASAGQSNGTGEAKNKSGPTRERGEEGERNER